ncbi:MAG: HD domain-containing protein [Catenisphaera adipataccumulans]|jgi:uncharacterized protein|uniref:HD domain-containing protein n=1 Tax=Catenisphaera adipataccumulans TaxID=700500 RepID=UPI003D9412A5
MEKIVAEAIMKMTAFYQQTSDVRRHDINHFLKVWGFAHTIGIAEGLDAQTQETLELAAVVHDIACPLCREKYGSTNGRYQEMEGKPLTRTFFEGFDLPAEQLERIVYLVGHHHSFQNVDGQDYQILLEADFLVNADESNLEHETIKTFRGRVFQTKTGRQLLENVYGERSAT